MIFKDLKRICETKFPFRMGVWVKDISCKKQWEFVILSLVTWTNMHLQGGKEKDERKTSMYIHLATYIYFFKKQLSYINLKNEN
jgi:hypothetical protein